MPKRTNTTTKTNTSVKEKKVTNATKKVIAPSFNIVLQEDVTTGLSYNRKGFYKIALTSGALAVSYREKVSRIEEPAIFLLSPETEIEVQNLNLPVGGFVLLFNKQFLNKEIVKVWQEVLQNQVQIGVPFLRLDDRDLTRLAHYFQVLFEEYHQDFSFKDTLLSNILDVVLLKIVKCQEENALHENRPESDLAEDFVTLLNNQFPLGHPKERIDFKNPNEFATYFQVHVNHLNFALKQKYRKTTTDIIQDRLLEEACDLLLNTKWPISDIGASLGFEYPQHFNVFFKKKTSKSPKQYRDEKIS